MKRLQNVLYVMTPGLYLRQEGEAVVIEKDRSVVMRLPSHTLNGIVCIGQISVSPYLMNHCAEKGIALTYLSEHGKFLARVEGPVSGNVRLRLAQMRAYETPERKTGLARNFVIGKVVNARSVILRCLRNHGERESLVKAAESLRTSVATLRQMNGSPDSVRGVEGHAASVYFSVFNDFLTVQRDVFRMTERNRRPPRDPMNALLSFLYTLLVHDCRGALEAVGLDPQIGFLHEVRPGRPGLALDLMEEFRSVLVDRLAVNLVNLKQLNGHDFKVLENGAVMMSDDARKTVLKAWQTKKQETVQHPFFEEQVPIGLLPHCQALLLARYLRGDLDVYPPYVVVK